MSAPKSLSPSEALEKFKEHHPELNTVENILSLPESRFVADYADFFNGDERKARMVYQEAQRIQEKAVLLWANIKDAVASPYIKETLFSNIPESFIRHQQKIPGYNQLFEKLDFVECDHCRSIFGPAAYFVDLLRFIEKHIPQDRLPAGHRLEDRHPRLYRMTLDCENTHQLIPYIDLVIEVLEDIVRTAKHPNPYAIAEESLYPMQLPFHLPLEEIRLYLKQLKTSLAEIYRVFGKVEPGIARELLGLSPREYDMIKKPVPDKSELDVLFGIDTGKTGRGSIRDVEVFLERTALTRKELNELLFLDLSDPEIQAGLSRLLFINNTGDNQGHIWIAEDVPVTTEEGLTERYDCLVNLTFPRLDRICRFLKLARKLDWKFADLDWALRSLSAAGKPEKVLYFDGVNDYISVPEVQNLDFEKFTLEAWVHPDQPGIHPVFCKGSPGGPFTHYLLWITDQGKLAFYHYLLEDGTVDLKPDDRGNRFPYRDDDTIINRDGLNLLSYQSLPVGAFSHVAVSINQEVVLEVDDDKNPSTPKVSKTFYRVNFYINGLLDSSWSLEQKIAVTGVPPSPGPLVINIGRNLQEDFFTGSIKEVRLWNIVRSEEAIREDRYRRFDGRENGLVAYWPLVDSPYLELRDISVRFDSSTNRLPNHHGRLGGDGHSAAPVWIQRELILDPLPTPVSPYSFLFDGKDQYLAAREVKGLDFSTFTLEGWVKRTGTGPHYLLSKGNAAENKTHFQLYITSRNRLALRSTSLNREYVSDTAITDNTLTHIAAVVDIGKVYLYINGELVNEANSDKYPDNMLQRDKDQLDYALDPQGDDLYLGRNFAASYLKGTVQEMRIWNLPRSRDQLNSNMHRQMIGNEPGLVSCWRLDEPDPGSQVARDLSYNRNHLIPGGIPRTYHPLLVSQREVLLPDPPASDARVLAFNEENYQLIISNALDQGLGHHEQVSLQFWFKAREAAATGRKQLLFSQGNEETGLSIYLFEGLLHLYAWSVEFGNDTPEKEVHLTSAAANPLQSNRWHHLTFTCDETLPGEEVQFCLYLNGLKEGQSSRGFRLPQTGHIFMGGIASGTRTRFNDGIPREGSHHLWGQISDLRLWKKVIPEDEITNPQDKQHPRHIPPLDEADLLAYLPMTEGYGRPVSDHSGPLFSGGGVMELDSSTINDQSVNDHQGKLYVGPDPVNAKWSESSLPIYAGTALRLDGTDDHLLFPNAIASALKKHDFTIEAWVKIDAFGADNPIIGSDGPPETAKTNQGLYLLVTGQARLKAGFYGDEVQSEDNLTAGEWHHIAWRYERQNRTQTLFIDGQAQKGGKIDSRGFLGNPSLYLGRWRDWLDTDDWAEHFFNGQISELRIWGTARRDEEIASLWQHHLRGDENDLLAYWKFDRDPRYVLIDRSAAAHPGVIETAPGTDIDAKWVEADTPVNRAFALDIDGDDDYIEISDYEITGAGTIELWVQFSRTRNQVLFDASNDDKSRDAHKKQKYFILEVKNQTLVFRLEDNADKDIDDAKINLKNLPPEFEGQWHHVVATWNYDSASQTTFTELYLDDLPKAADKQKGNGIKPFLQSPYVGINRGAYDTVINNPFQGRISQIRIWDHVRSIEEIRTLRQATLQGNEAGLLVYLPIYEGRGNLLHNLASNNTSLLQVGPTDNPDSKWLDDKGLPVPGKFVFQFDHDSVVLPHSSAMGITGSDFTIEVWVNLREDTMEYPILAARGSMVNQPEEELLFSVQQKRPRAVIQGQELLGDNIIPANEWHHITWRYNAASQELNIFVDGVKDSRILEQVKPYTVYRHLYIGLRKQWDKAAKQWKQKDFLGMIEEVRIWNITREDADIVRLMTRRLTGSEPGLTGYWTFTGEHRRTVFDRTSHRHALEFFTGEGDSLNGKYIFAEPPVTALRPSPALDGYNDYLDLAHPYAPDGKTWTIECWAKLHKTAGRQILFSKAGLFRAVFDEGCFRFEWQYSNHWNEWAEIFEIRSGIWQHIAVVYNGDNHELQVFHNGEAVSAPQSHRLLNDRERSFRFGTDENLLPGEFLAGEVAEIRLWDTARDAAGIRENFRRYLSGREDQLIGYWPLAEGHNALLYEQAENFLPGALISGLENPAAKWLPSPPPFSGAFSALYFDGHDDQVILPHTIRLDLQQDFTVEAWVKVEDLDSDRPLAVLGSKAPESAGKDNQALCLGVKNGKPYFSFYHNDFHPDIPLSEQWHHLTWQYQADNQTMRIIVDDQPLLEDPGHAPFAGQGKAYIGRWSDWDDAAQSYKNHYFMGLIGEVRIWNALRDVSEIAADRNRRIAGNAPGLAAYWIFDDQHQSLIPGRSGESDNLYQLILRSDANFQQPLWEAVSDHPLLLNPLSRQGLLFDGKRKHLAAENVQLPMKSDFTLEAWLSFDHDQDSPVLWKGSAEGHTDLELRVNASGHIEFYYRKENQTHADPLNLLASGTPISANVFTHIAVIAGGTSLTIYIDGLEAENISLDAAIRHSEDGMLMVGRNTDGRHFKGIIKELRLWNVPRTAEDLRRTRYHSLIDPDRTAELVGYWPLDTVEEQWYAPDRSANNHPLRLGGLEQRRKPTSALTTAAPLEFFDRRRKALTIRDEMPDHIQIPKFNPPLYPNRSQRTIELWFMSENTLAPGKQIIYREGDSQQTLGVFIEDGLLQVEGYQKYANERYPLVSERITSGRWHHLAIVLDGRRQVRDDAFKVLLDGKVIDTRPAVRLSGPAEEINLGGLRFTPPLDPPHTLETGDITAEQVTGNWYENPAGGWSDRNKAKGYNALTFTHQQDDGWYRISVRYPQDDPISPRYATNTPVEILHKGGTETVFLNQQNEGGGFRELGIFELQKDLSAITIRNDNTDGRVVFEALQLNPIHRETVFAETHIQQNPDALQGQILEVRIWECARSPEEIRQHLYDIGTATPAEALLFHWITDTIPDPEPLNLTDYLSALQLSLFDLPASIMPSNIPLPDLSYIQELRTRYNLSIDKLAALWSEMKHTGTADNRTLFNDIYNPLNTPAEDQWFYYPVEIPVWEVSSSNNSHQRIRTRLMSALRVSQQQLYQMVEEISGPGARWVLLSNQYLSSLYRLKLLSKTLKLKIGQLRRLVSLMQMEGYPLNDLPNFTLNDLRLLEERVNWMNESGIDLSEYDYLTYDVQDERVSPPYNEASVVELAGSLKDQAADFLAGPLSLVSEDITEAASDKIYQHLTAAGMITAQGAVTGDFREFSDLSLIAEELNWYQTQQTADGEEIRVTDFRDLYISEEALLQAGIINDSGMVITEDPRTFSIGELEKLYRGKEPQPERMKIALLHDLLTRRKAAQENIPLEVTGKLREMRSSLDTAILTALTGLLATEQNLLQLVMTHTEGKMSGADFLAEMELIKESQKISASPEVEALLYKLSKCLFLLSQFDLSNEETEALLSRPETFGLQAASLVRPSFADLTRLHCFGQLKETLKDSGNQLLQVLQADHNNEDALSAFTGWKPFEIRLLAALMELGDQYNTLSSIWRMAPAFRLARTLGVDMEYLIDLSDTANLDFEFYQRHANALFGILKANYEEDTWARVYKPLHDMLAVKKRDSLTTIALENLAASLTGRQSPDLLYEYLLIDVQMGSETSTSRIVQGIAALQLYVQRCLMNLEKDIDPEQIPLDEWQWMKNYRVWEANRKVFLYPENYIEPELRDTKTPLFRKLEEELLQGDINKESVKIAFTHYLDKLAEVTNLDIVGTYYHTGGLDVRRTHALKFSNEESEGYIKEVSGYITISSTRELATLLPKDFTAELWMKHDHANSCGGILSAFSWMPDKQKGWLIQVDHGKIALRISTDDANKNQTPGIDGKFTTLQTAEIYPADTWLHVAVTYDGNTVNLLVNGIEAASDVSRSGNIYYPAGAIPFLLGALQYHNTGYIHSPFRGEIRELRLWNIARTREEIFETMHNGVIPDDQGAMPASLVGYWKMDDGPGELGDNTAITDYSRAGTPNPLDITGLTKIEWVETEDTAISELSESEIETTLYLIGKKKESQEFYFRELINGTRWLPWKKIDLSISADYVSPVFAFGRLYLFWAEIQQGIDSQKRINTTTIDGKNVDQIGEPLDASAGEKIDNHKRIHDLHGTIMQVNVPVYKPIIKYSFYNFSKAWTQPQSFLDANKKELPNLSEWERLMPKWQRVYVQRSLEFMRETDTVLQPPPETISNVKVLKLESQSYLEKELPRFIMDELTLSCIVKVKDLKDPNSADYATVDKPAENSVTLLTYEEDKLIVRLTTELTAIAGKIEAYHAAAEGLAAIEKVHEALRSIQDYRDDQNQALLPAGELKVVAASAREAGNAASGNYRDLGTRAADTATEAVNAIDAAPATIPETPPASATVRSNHAATLAEALAATAEDAANTAAAAAKIFIDAQADADDALQNAAAARMAATEARVYAESAKDAEEQEPPDQALADQQAAEADSKMSEALEKSLIALSKTQSAVSAAKTREDAAAKWESLNMQLKLNIAGEELVSGNFPYDSWQHITITCERSGSAYQVQLYLEGAASGSRQTFTSPEFPAGQILRIGSPNNDETILETLVSEFRLWNYARPAADILADNRVRKTGREIGLFHLPLDGLDSTSTTVWVNSDLDLTHILPPINPLAQRERIIMIYGDKIRSLRSNLEDKGVILQLETRYENFTNYNISLSPSNLGTSLRIDQPGGIFVDHYAPHKRYPLDRYAPDNKNKILIPPASLPDKYFYQLYNQVLTSIVQDQTRSNIYPELLKNLVIAEAYILDIANHPAWFILDAGDEQFLVKIGFDGKHIKTAEERLRFKYDTENATTDSRPVSLYFERDLLLEVHPLRQPTFEFERLNTFAIQTLSDRLFTGGIEALLSLKSQQTNEPDFGLMKASDKVISPKNDQPGQPIDNRIDFKGAYGLYYREVFFHAPFLIANHLNANQKFAEAQQWYHYIFNPTAQEPDVNPDGTFADPKDRYWRYREFRNLSQKTLAEMLSDKEALAEYRRDPFDPHAIASLRLNAYQKAVVMKYIDNLLDWGDYLFRQDTREAINEAVPLYVLAFNLLGPRPKAKKLRRFEQIGDYRAVQAGNPGAIPEFLARVDSGNSSTEPAFKIPFNPNSSIETRFCVIENEQFMSYWDRVEDRLYKIRHSLNIDGVFRSLALFQPPIEPGALVAAAAAGSAGGLAGAIAGLSVAVPHYRFSYMLNQAKEITETVISLGSALLEALEKKDSETLTLLQHTNEDKILKDMSDIKQNQIKEIVSSKAALEVSRDMAEYRMHHFQRLIDSKNVKDSSKPSEARKKETQQINQLIAAIVFKDLQLIGKTLASIFSNIPEAEAGGSGFGGSPVLTTKWKWYVGFEIAAGVLEIVAESLSLSADIVGIEAGYLRRLEEWQLERQVAEYEKKQIDRQIETVNIQIEIAQKELALHQKTIALHKEVGDFYKQKFSNLNLYNWMSNRLADLYFRAYQMAFDTAKLAEKAFQFEFGTNESYISFGHWDSRRQGLLAGESLRLDIQRLEKSAIAQDSRYLEIEKTISLARLDPLAFLELKESGSCQFSLTELLFDRDYPGHYFRIIKSLSISIPTEAELYQPGKVTLTPGGYKTSLAPGSYQIVKATLTQTGHKTLLAPDISGVQYLMGESSDMPLSIRADWRANQQIAISTGVNDSGMFELNFRDDRYLPFEGTGAVSNWHLEIPRATNPIDFDSIPDVIIHLRYMSKVDGGKFKQDVMKLETFKNYRGVRMFSLAHEFSTQWENFKNPNTNVRTLELPLPDNTFPANVTVDFDTLYVKAIFSLNSDDTLLDAGDQFDITLPKADDSPRLLILSARDRFQKETSANLLILLSYEGELMGA